MGASSWRHYTPYRPDPEAALQELRQAVFERGDYSMGFGGMARPDGLAPGGPQKLMEAARSGDYTGLTEFERTIAEQLAPVFRRPDHLRPFLPEPGEAWPGMPGDHKPESIDELLEMVAEDGTHSILDIASTGEDGVFGVAAPLPPNHTRRAFGTEQPTHEQVEELWAAVAEPLDRWQAYYVVVYKDGKPDEYAFIGCSGD
jgi:hypothetical protein